VVGCGRTFSSKQTKTRHEATHDTDGVSRNPSDATTPFNRAVERLLGPSEIHADPVAAIWAPTVATFASEKQNGGAELET